MLSIEPTDLHPSLPIQAVSSGVMFFFVPIKNLETMSRLKLRPDMLEDPKLPSKLIFPFCIQTERKDSTVHGRMFAPSLGIAEDPATGGAAGPLGSYLLEHGVVDANRAKQIIVEQGFEMGRPSILHVSVSRNKDKIQEVLVGGTCVAVGEGVVRPSQ
jgi:trans-2,3-dihydro-3-hydroxyanthranilate isomerase